MKTRIYAAPVVKGLKTTIIALDGVRVKISDNVCYLPYVITQINHKCYR